jgi:hypothetical protein
MSDAQVADHQTLTTIQGQWTKARIRIAGTPSAMTAETIGHRRDIPVNIGSSVGSSVGGLK